MSARWLRAPWPLYHLLQSLRSLADRPTILLSIFLFGTGVSLRRDPRRAHHLELIPFARGPLCPNYVLCLRALCPLLAGYLSVPGLTCHQANVSRPSCAKAHLSRSAFGFSVAWRRMRCGA